MALYRLETKIINRQNRGRSVIPSAAYRSGSILHKAAYRSANILEHALARLTFNYKARAQEVVHTEILAPENGPSWLQTPAEMKDDMSHQRDMTGPSWKRGENADLKLLSSSRSFFFPTFSPNLFFSSFSVFFAGGFSSGLRSLG
jgi:hypothetical protein